MELTAQHLLGIQKCLVEIDLEKDKVVYKNLRSGEKKYKFSDPEEQVRLDWFLDLILKYQYESSDIDLEVEMPKRVPNQLADLVLYNAGVDNKYFVIEFKKANITDNEFEQAVKQGIGNGRILKAKYYGTIAGETVRFFEEGKDDSLDDAFYSIPVKYGKPEEWTFTKGGVVDLEPVTSESLETVLSKAHQTIWDGGRRDKSRAFGEVAKIIFIKMWDEHKARKIGEAYEFQRKRNESVEKLAFRIHAIYNEAKQRDKHVFAEDIKLNDKELAVVVEHLQRLSLTKTELDVKGEAFQKFLGSFFKGDFGSYFTPSFVSKFCIDLFGEDIQNYDKVLDPACGSGGFLLKTLDLIRQKADEYYKKDSPEHYRYRHDFAVNNLFGIEISEDTARIAKMNMILHEDGHTNVIGHDALDKIEKMQALNLGFKKEGFDYIFTNPPFGASVKSTIKDYLGDYELAKNGSKLKDIQDTEILFIERCWQFLKPEGKLVIILPDGFLTRTTLQGVREWVLEKFKLLGVVSLSSDTFKYYGTGIKASILILEKYGDKVEKDYKIFMAKADKVGITSTGKKCENDLIKIAKQFRKFLNNEIEIKEKLDFIEIKSTQLENRFDFEFYKNVSNISYKYPNSKLGDYVKIQGGYMFSSKDYKKSGIPIIRIGEISNGKVCNNTDIFWENTVGLDKFILKKGDILIAMTGATIGKVGRVIFDGLGLLNQRVGKINIIDNNLLDENYLLYILNSNIFQDAVKKYSLGGAQPNISTKGIENIFVNIPPIKIQKEIVEKIIFAENEKIKLEKEIKNTDKKLDEEIKKILLI